jgi:hypothetical protein
MRLLLTSGGVTNPSIRETLVELLGKPMAESSALCIPTAVYGHPSVGPGVRAWQFISGRSENPMVDLGTLGLVDFSICPHLAPDGRPGNSMAEAEQWAAGITGPAYAMDDQTAITVVDGAVEVVSEGHWRLFPS